MDSCVLLVLRGDLLVCVNGEKANDRPRNASTAARDSVDEYMVLGNLKEGAGTGAGTLVLGTGDVRTRRSAEKRERERASRSHTRRQRSSVWRWRAL